MRILFTTLVSPGHLRPMVPLAWALRSLGHEVIVTCPPNQTRFPLAAGLNVMPYGQDIEPIGAMRRRLPDGVISPADLHGGGITPERARMVGAAIGRIAATSAEEVTAFARAWRPDVIVHEPMEMTGRVAAAVLGIPSVLHRWGLETLATFNDGAAAELEGVCARLGITTSQLTSTWVIDPTPPSLILPGTRPGWPMRYVPDNGSAIVPAWTLQPPARRRVCVTVGNLMLELGGMPALRAMLDALQRFDVEVIAAVRIPDGEHTGGDRPNVKIIALPISQFIGSCDLVLHHGGTGSSFTTIAAGLPQLVFPQLADEFEYGQACEDRHIGRYMHLPAHQRDPDAIADAIDDLLTDPRYLKEARAVREESEALPTPWQMARTLTDAVHDYNP